MRPLTQATRPHLAGRPPVPRSVQLLVRQEHTAQPPIRLAEQPGPPTSELVLVDQHEAQGWRVRQDERLDRLFEERCDLVRMYGRPGHLAVDSDGLALTYDELDARANQLARFLRLHGAGAGDRIALLFDRPTDSYLAMLAVLKIGAAYVPLDTSFPADRVSYIVEDARVRTVLSVSWLAARVEHTQLTARGVEFVHLDQAAPLIAELSSRRLIDAERGIVDDQLAYIIYTAGSNDRPKGVPVDHRSICNFVKVAAEVYGLRPRDRVYQGLPIAFDFSVEEIWVPWIRGATLVPRPAGAGLRGQDLHRFLSERRVTAMCCVPTLLATIPADLPDLRFLLVSGQACPQDLIVRWHRPGRRFLGVYGPAEATVTATWTELHPDRPVTLGIPLPTYSTVILDVADPRRALPPGEIGEIGIAGIGIACGYVNRDDLTETAFVPDFLSIPANPSGRIYRTGDLGRVNSDGEIEYHGRVDQQDARGYRDELTEIESALLRALEAGLATIDTPAPVETPAAPATPAHPMAGIEADLAAVLADVLGIEDVLVNAHFFDDLGADSMTMARFCARLRKRDDLPTPSIKDIYQYPTITALATAFAPAPADAPAAVDDNPAAALTTALAEVLADVVGVDTVPVDAHFFDDLGADSMTMARFCARLRKRDDLPTPSIKDIYQYPTITALATAFAPAPATADSVATTAGTERDLAVVLAEVLSVDSVPVDAHFFDDLGADSMTMARFCARLRKRDDLPTPSIKDVYAHPTLRRLATAIAEPAPTPVVQTATVVPAAPVAGDTNSTARTEPQSRITGGKPRYFLCGALQLLFFLAYSYAAAVVTVRGYEWITAGSGLIDSYLRSVAFGAAGFVTVCILPIVAKWALVGRWKPQQIRIWSLAYLRFWLVKTLIRANPLVLFVGSPLYSLYLRALGAKVGRGVVILSRNVPVCTDMLTIGDGTVIRKDSFFSGYRAHSGLIQTGRVTLGKNVLICEATVLDIETSMGDDAQLGHTSSLHAGQVVPAGEAWHGSPGQPADVNYRLVQPARRRAARSALYSVGQLISMLVVHLPLTIGGVDLLLSLPRVQALQGSAGADYTSPVFYLETAAISFVIFSGLLLVGLLVMVLVPRVLNLAIKPDTVYPLYGLRYSFHRAITRLTNSKFLTALFGDSSFIVPYLRALGYKLTPVVQTGSNFGTEVKHDSPFLSSVGTGTVCASELSIINADYSSTSFKVSRTHIGSNSFLGNMIHYPAQSRAGDNCLLATKVLVPIDGKVREGVGLLGSPSFEIPRTVERDSKLAHLAHGDEMRRRLRAKNRHNLATMGMFLLARWFYTFVITMIGFGALDLYASLGAAALALSAVATLLFSTGYGVLVERASTGFKPLPPKYCSIYDVEFWRTERFFKLEAAVSPIFNGTPFKGAILRLLGVRVGKRLFDDGGSMAEKNLVTLGDDVILNAGAWIQCHSQEDNAFKSDRITIGSGCTIGSGAFILYGAEMGDGAVLAPDSFLMKGEEITPNERWGGNPAHELPDTGPAHLLAHRGENDTVGSTLVGVR